MKGTPLPVTLDTPRWQPDENLVPSILTARTHQWATLTPTERAYTIAHLDHTGRTTEQIADLLHCHPDTITHARRDPAHHLAAWAVHAEHHAREAARKAANTIRAHNHAQNQANAEIHRLRTQRNHLIDQLAACRTTAKQTTTPPPPTLKAPPPGETRQGDDTR